MSEFQSEPENGHKLPEGKSVDVFNALSLFHEDLGKKYEQDGYNPLGEDFVLTEEYAQDILTNKSEDISKIVPENFLEFGNKQVSKHFDNALQNGNKILESLDNELAVCPDEKTKKQLKKFVVLVKNRNELLKIGIDKLKQKDANALKMYLEMYGMDSELSEILKDTFNETANNQFIISQMLNLAKNRGINLKQKAKDIKQILAKEQFAQQQEQILQQNNAIQNQNKEQEKQEQIAKEQEENKQKIDVEQQKQDEHDMSW